MNALAICPLFSDHAVLLRSEKVPVWGRGRPGTMVKATLNGRSTSTCVAPSGRWEVQFNTLNMPDGLDGQLALAVESEGECLISRNIVMGEVWLCSGQSNMGMRLINTAGADVEIARPVEPRLRHFKVKPRMAPAPTEELQGEWQICNPDTVGDFSAVAYYFGKRLLVAQGGIVGVINSSWGNTTLEAWSSAAAMDEIPELHAERLRDDAYPVREEDDPMQQGVGVFEGDTRLLKHRSTVLFNAMIHPLSRMPFAASCGIKGSPMWHGPPFMPGIFLS